MKKTGKDITCKTCGNNFYASGWRLDSTNVMFCSRKCRRHTDNTKKMIGLVGIGRKAWNDGKNTGLVPKSAFKKGLSPWNKGKTGLQVGWLKGKKNPSIQKENHWNWKGGITSIEHKGRTNLEYKLWRKDVLSRDEDTCQICGVISSVNMHANHIKPFKEYKELRYETGNGITLCSQCHKKLVDRSEHEWESYFLFNIATRAVSLRYKVASYSD